jgi:YYY domain-containing protein
VWTGAYFLWRGSGFNPTMRYQLPIYPTLALFASWAFWEALARARDLRIRERLPVSWLVGGVGAFVIAATFAYAVAFATNYVRPFTRYNASSWIYQNIPGPVNLLLNDTQLEPIPYPGQIVLDSEDPTEVFFRSHSEGELTSVYLPYVNGPLGETASLVIVLSDNNGQLAQGIYEGQLAAEGESRIEVKLDRPVSIENDKDYSLRLESGLDQSLSLRGSVLITETSWDDALPLRIEGRDGFSGLYTGLNQELYWADDEDKEGNGIPDKLERLDSSLTDGDYLIITSSRQYGSVGRLPQRWPLTVAYYRALFGCPSGVAVEVCAADAQPGEVRGELGYELMATFEQNPKIGPLEFKDQLAEEAFTVYDHPKVLIFAKQAEFDPAVVQAALAGVDVSHVQNLPPNEIGSVQSDLLLTEEQLEIQRSGGTWSELFSRESLINRSQPLGVIAWWLMIVVLGLLAFPMVRTAFPGLRDGGYPLSKLVALLFIAWASWMAGSIGLRYTRLTILLMVVVMAAVSGVLAWRDRDSLRTLFRERRREILFIEALALGFFLFDLAIRTGNPDLWHRFLGGEKPMDFAYLNAVLRSSIFPPLDPWYAGGYINYYYFGFVLVGTPIKLLGLLPSVAYNLVIPTLLSMTALGAYTVGTNLVARLGKAYDSVRMVSPKVAGLAAALSLVVLGNLGTVKLIYGALEEVGARDNEGSTPGLVNAAVGLGRVLSQQDRLPVGLHHWYWEPSRAITATAGEAGPITEFPFFTFLYADLHAHMINLPLTVLALGWAISWVLAADKQIALRWVDHILAIGMGALVIGVLAPTNTWDFPVYWTLGALAVAVAPFIRERSFTLKAAIEAVVSVGVLLLLANLLFRPYYIWYGLGYSEADLWQGSRTTILSYLTVHGLFLIVLVPWLAWETRQWMAATPLSSLSRIRPYFGVIVALVLAVVFAIAFLAADGFSIAPIVALVLIWCGALILRRNYPIEKRIVVMMVGTAAALTFLVEAVVLVGDISRMNTVFKFYLQVWTLFTLAGSAALVWLLADLPAWGQRARWAWSAIFALALFGAALYPLTASLAKVRDRMAPLTPISLDGMAFMKEAVYDDLGQQISLAGDYDAIRWMQDNVEGSPVIVEAQIPEYRWGSRFSIYTGLPAVLGWNWHQRQQRAAVEVSDVPTRADDISSFYLTTSPSDAIDFLSQYDVRYIVVGELEQLYYGNFDKCQPIDGGGRVTCDMAGRLVGQRTLEVPASQCETLGSALACPTGGLEKFDAMESLGILRAVYRNGSTIIYEVLT